MMKVTDRQIRKWLCSPDEGNLMTVARKLWRLEGRNYTFVKACMRVKAIRDADRGLVK